MKSILASFAGLVFQLLPSNESTETSLWKAKSSRDVLRTLSKKDFVTRPEISCGKGWTCLQHHSCFVLFSRYLRCPGKNHRCR